MLRWLLFALFFYLIFKLIQGPKRRNTSRVNYRFGSQNPGRTDRRRANGRIDHIEEAEFEDITDKEKNS